MDVLEQILIIKAFHENKNFEITTNVNISLGEIKKQFAEKIKYNENNMENINLWYIDEDQDKNLINNTFDLIKYSKEIDFSKCIINLILEINNKKIELIKITKNLKKIKI